MIWNDHSLAVGFYLAKRDISRSNPWTTLLIIIVMMLTFFNMLFIGGILVGLADAAVASYNQYYSGDILIIPASNKTHIQKTTELAAIIKSFPSVREVSIRYTAPAILEYKFREKSRQSDLAETSSGTLTGIDAAVEGKPNHLAGAIVAGSFLTPLDVDSIVIGSNLIDKYATARGAALALGGHILKTADVGSRVRLTVNGISREVMIKGVITTNSVLIDSRIYMVDSAMRDLTDNTSLNANEISIFLVPGASDTEVKRQFLKIIGNDPDIIVDTALEAMPSSILTIFNTFRNVGDLVGAISLVAGAITIFIVIFVNAVTRRKYIGILKGIGISPTAIEISYIVQALFYAITGIIIASILILYLIKPYFIIHPFNFALAPSSLDIGVNDVMIRAIILTITSFISGLIPAYIVTKQNTLDAILGR